MNPFGPQGAQASIAVPAGNSTIRYPGDTWVKDCSAPGLNDGTQLDAGFFNNIIGNLNYLVRQSGLVLILRGDMTLLYSAVSQMITAATSVLSAQVKSSVAQVFSLTAQMAVANTQIESINTSLLSLTARVAALENVAALSMPVQAFSYATLPSSPSTATPAYVIDGRKVGEAAGAGTGVMAYYANGAWRVFSTDEAVTV